MHVNIPHLDPSQDLTVGQLYSPAMECQTSVEADSYYCQLLKYYIERWGKTPIEADTIIRSNIGYFAGYMSAATRSRVYQLFCTEHPVLGKV